MVSLQVSLSSSFLLDNVRKLLKDRKQDMLEQLISLFLSLTDCFADSDFRLTNLKSLYMMSFWPRRC